MNNFFIDLYPEHSSWDEWSNGVAYVYGSQNLPTVPESRWREFADVLVSVPLFGGFAIPDGFYFDSWRDWAESILTVTNGRTNGNI